MKQTGLTKHNNPRVLLIILLSLLLNGHANQPPAATFMPAMNNAGINHRYDGGWEYFVGGGVATFDCNNDTLPELYLAGGSNPAQLYKNNSTPGGQLEFSALESGLNMTHVTGAYPLDIDGDDITDVVVLRVGENMLFRGLGNCAFERANEQWGFNGGNDWTTAFAAYWPDENTFPTLAFGNYINRNAPGAPFGTCANNQLFKGTPDGFKDALELTPSFCTLSLLFSDWDRSGSVALRVSNDRQYYLTNKDRRGQEQLWGFNDDGEPFAYDESLGWEKLQIWGMGIASADVTGDGYPEVYLTSMADNKLRSLTQPGTGTPTYKDMAFERGVTVHRPFTGEDTNPSTGWHAQFEDVNNDTRLDLFVTKGNVESMPDFAQADPNNLLIAQPDGTFIEAADSANILSFHRARGASVSDLNADGWLDIVVMNRKTSAEVWRNTSANTRTNNWLNVRLKQPNHNRDAIGAWLTLKTTDETGQTTSQTRELTSGGGHASGNHTGVHFGLGKASTAQLQIQWPDGTNSPWLNVNANQTITLQKDTP